MRSASKNAVWVLVAGCLALSAVGVKAEPADKVLRVCADPANMPLSNDKGEGYENKIAEALAKDLGKSVEYTYFPQRIGFIRNTLKLKDTQTQRFKCDVIIGVPKGYELTATTQPYLHATYALIFAARPEFSALQDAADLLKLPPQKLQHLRIGVFTRSPGVDWLLKNSMLDNAAMFSHQTGDVQESPAKVIERELAAQRIDAGILWGPIAGMLVSQHAGSPPWRAVPFQPEPGIRFDYEISMGVRFGEKEWKDTLDQWISAHRQQIDAILTSYHVPLVAANSVASPQ